MSAVPFIPRTDLYYPLARTAAIVMRADSVLRDLVAEGKIPAKKEGRLLLIRPDDVMRYYNALPDAKATRQQRGDGGEASGREVQGDNQKGWQARLRPELAKPKRSPKGAKREDGHAGQETGANVIHLPAVGD